MSVTQNPISGRSSGKYANAIFQTQYGRNILRSKPLTVNQPNTKAQLHSQAEFRLAGTLAGAMNPFISKLYLASSVRMPAAAVVVKWLINNAISTVGDQVILDPNKLLPVQDTFNLSDYFIVDKETPDFIYVNWAPGDIPTSFDPVFKMTGIFYDIDNELFFHPSNTPNYWDGQLIFNVPGDHAATNFICYMLIQRTGAIYKPDQEFFQAFYQ